MIRELFQSLCGLFGHPWKGTLIYGHDPDVDGEDVRMVCSICGCPLNPMYHR